MQPMTLATRRQSFAQVVFCLGCCCGRTDRGRPEVPVERLKAAWRAEKLNATVQLTISGCLGPCDLANVALVILPEGNVWLGNLEGEAPYDALTDWARRCHAAGEIRPLPATLDPYRFERFVAERSAV
jgi:cobaltochelatase CobN